MAYLFQTNKRKPLFSIVNIVVFCLIICSNIGSKIFAQDLEPRRWTPMPLGVNVIGGGYAYTHGEIFFDPLLQAEDVTTEVSSFVLIYVRPFKLGNKLARIDAMVPYSLAQWDGMVSDVAVTVKRNGFADPRLRFSLNLIGPNAMGPKKMQEYMAAHPVNTTVGVSLAITFPLGQYFGDKLLNLGQNRFVFRPQIGMVHNWGNWSYEFTTSVFLFTANEDFYIDRTNKQDPVFAFQTHLMRRFKHRIWASLSVGYGLRGQSIVNSQPNKDQRGDLAGGFSLGFPLMKKHSLKFAIVRSQTSKDVGSDMNSFAIVWSFLF